MSVKRYAGSFAEHKIGSMVHIDDYSALEEKYKSAVEWQPIETAPKDGSAILLYSPKHGTVEGGWDQVDGGGHPENGPSIYWWASRYVVFEDGPYDAPTHWMPLPAPPDHAASKESL
jgi:Protein of unknown function (DUF551)